jgi:hypothetical protein
VSGFIAETEQEDSFKRAGCDGMNKSKLGSLGLDPPNDLFHSFFPTSSLHPLA